MSTMFYYLILLTDQNVFNLVERYYLKL